MDRQLSAAGTSRVRGGRQPRHIALVATDARAIERLADQEDVAWMYPATTDVLAPGALMCGGLVSGGGLTRPVIRAGASVRAA